MNEFKERYLKQLETTATEIMRRVGNTGEFTKSDLAFLAMYKRELNNNERKPFLATALSTLKDITDFINKNLNGGD